MFTEDLDCLETVAENPTIAGGVAIAQSSIEAQASGSDLTSVMLSSYTLALSLPGNNVAQSSSSSLAIASSD